MLKKTLSAKIHRATVTAADLNYVGSITIDAHLMELAGIAEFEMVQIVNINNGERFETYVMTGEADTGVIQINGAAARLVAPGDLIIIMGVVYAAAEELPVVPRIVHVDRHNRPITEAEALRLPH